MSSNVDSDLASLTHISHLTGLMLRTLWVDIWIHTEPTEISA